MPYACSCCLLLLLKRCVCSGVCWKRHAGVLHLLTPRGFERACGPGLLRSSRLWSAGWLPQQRFHMQQPRRGTA